MTNLVLRLFLILTFATIAACGGSSDPSGVKSGTMEFSLKPTNTTDGLGFFDINSDQIPDNIKAAALSVFEQRVLGGTAENLRSIDVTTPEKVAAVKDRINQLKESDFDKLDKIVLLKEVERCERWTDLEAKKACTISFDIRKSTGFLLDSGDTLWTNSHAIESSIAAAKKYEHMELKDFVAKKHPVRIFLFDSSGHLVMDPYKETVTIQRLPPKTKVAEMHNKFYGEDLDFIVLKLPRAIGSPLARAKTNIPYGKVYLAGYSICTACVPYGENVDKLDFTDRGVGLNSNGVGLKFSMGHLVNGADVWTGFFNMSADSAKVWNLNTMLFYSADSQYGSSGSPVLNEAGEVLGLHAGGRSKSEAGTFRRVSRGVLLPAS